MKSSIEKYIEPQLSNLIGTEYTLNESSVYLHYEDKVPIVVTKDSVIIYKMNYPIGDFICDDKYSNKLQSLVWSISDLLREGVECLLRDEINNIKKYANSINSSIKVIERFIDG